jgi:uncharacterized protein YqgV (UPF0045/DUF77 family)
MKNEKPEYSRESFDATTEGLSDLELDLATSPEGADTSEVESEIESARERLRALMGQAHTEAIKEDLERELSNVLPVLEKAKEHIQEKVAQLEDPSLRRYGEELIAQIDNVSKFVHHEKGALPAPTFFERAISMIGSAYQLFLKRANDISIGQNRYGGGRGPQPA